MRIQDIKIYVQGSMSKRSAPVQDISPPPLRRKPNPTNIQSVSGGAISTRLPTHNVHIFSWNVNGIGAFLQKPITSFFAAKKDNSENSLREFLSRHDWPHMLCLQEVKINRKDEGTCRAFERAANANIRGKADEGPGYTTHFCLPRDKYNAKGFGGKIYGVATLIRDDFLAEQVLGTRDVEWDQEGRFLVTELRSQVVIINGYWVNGTSNPYRNSETGLQEGTRHDRKREVHRLMLEESLRYEARGWSVVLVGDMNIARCELDGHPDIRMDYSHVVNRANFNTAFFTAETGMRAIDAFRHLHGNDRKYTYYGRSHAWGTSCDRVDLVVLSRKVVDEKRLVAADIYNTPLERGHSDHVPLSVTLDLSPSANQESPDDGRS